MWARITQLAWMVVFLPVILLLSLVALVVVPIRMLYGIGLNVLIWICWCARGRNVMLVYSDSPHWKDYIERDVLPRLPLSTKVLNWSERRRWRRFSLAAMAFRYFGGHKEFNPMVLIFRPGRVTKTFRFWQAFRDAKHGSPQRLSQVERELFLYLNDGTPQNVV